MISRRPLVLTAAVVLLATAAAAPAEAAGPPVAGPPAKNVILLIDDGAGYATHEIGSLYDTGLPDGEAYNDFPFRFAVSTYSYGDVVPGQCIDLVGYDPTATWSDFATALDRPTDSAAAATAMATGVKTYDKAIGVDCQATPAPAPNIVEAFEASGRSTGVVSSVIYAHATPASFVAHHAARDQYLEIGDQMILVSAADVIMGAGHPLFSNTGAPQTARYTYIRDTTWAQLQGGTAGADADGDGDNDPWTLIQTRAEFQALMTGDTPSRVFGLPQIRRTLQSDRSGDKFAAPYVVPFKESIPRLSEMTAGALNVLDQDEDGFFLMIEGGATDWAAHDNWPGRMIEEEIEFNRAVDAALAWVDAYSNWGETMLIVVSDHETGYVTGPGSGQMADGPVWNPVVSNGIGVMPGFEFNSEEHTNSLVPIYAKGDAARVLRFTTDGTDPVRGRYIDNTDIFRLMLGAIGG